MAEECKMHHVAWFLAGLGVGALIGVLYAPKSGREIREEIASGARESSEFLRDRSRQAVEEMSSIVNKGREQVNEYVDRGRSQWDEFVERGKNLVNDQSGRVSAAVEAGRQAYKTTAAPNEEPEL